MKGLGAALAFGLVFLLLVVILINSIGPEQDAMRATKAMLAEQRARELAPLQLTFQRVFWGSLTALVSAVGMVALAVGVSALLAIPDVKRAARIRSWLVNPKRNALYPALAAPDGKGHITVIPAVNERLSQPIAAMTNGHVDRLGGAGQVVKQLTNPKDENHPFGEEPLPIVTPDQEINPDLRNRPDTLLVGAKGSGKTSALRWLIERYGAAFPDAEFIVCSPIASNWNIDGVISDPIQVRDTILALYKEMNRRDQILLEAKITDYHKWAERPRPVVVVIDEAESTMDAIELVLSVKDAKNFGRVLRIFVNRGRNFGFAIIQATQSARTDVLDSTFMHQVGTLLMMRMDAATSARFNEYDQKIVAQLPRLPAGRAYCPQVNGYIQFPEISELRRQPRMSRVYQPKTNELARPDGMLRLPADAESDGLGADDLPDTHGEYAGVGRELSQPLATYNATTGLEGGVRTVATVVQLPKRQPTPVEAARMRAHYARTHSKTAVCMTFYGYKDGDTWAWVMQALEGKI